MVIKYYSATIYPFPILPMRLRFNNSHATFPRHASWWAVATMSTVGYGDVYPITPLGQVVGTVVSFLSMIFLAMPLTIIVSSFSKTYRESKKGMLLRVSMTKARWRLLHDMLTLITAIIMFLKVNVCSGKSRQMSRQRDPSMKL